MGGRGAVAKRVGDGVDVVLWGVPVEDGGVVGQDGLQMMTERLREGVSDAGEESGVVRGGDALTGRGERIIRERRGGHEVPIGNFCGFETWAEVPL